MLAGNPKSFQDKKTYKHKYFEVHKQHTDSKNVIRQFNDFQRNENFFINKVNT